MSRPGRRPTLDSGAAARSAEHGSGVPGLPAGPSSAFGVPLASWGQRAAAYALDALIVTVAFGAAVTAWFAALAALPAELAQRIAMSGTVALGFAIPWLYFGVLNGSNSGQTLGKRAAAIQVRHAETGEPLGVAKGLLRQAVVIGLALALTFPAVLNYLAPLWDAKRQAWHDKVVGSVVIALGLLLTEGDSQGGPDNPAPGSHPS